MVVPLVDPVVKLQAASAAAMAPSSKMVARQMRCEARQTVRNMRRCPVRLLCAESANSPVIPGTATAIA
jgi:hypothetical protein